MRQAIVAGDGSGLESLLGRLLENEAPVSVIERHLVPAMDEVGRLFERGEMYLPFVLRSAETVRQAFGLLEPHLPHDDAGSQGKLVLATVRGDIHDVGKNLVDIILSSSGFRVVNLGVGQTPDDVLSAVRAETPDAVGLSGLLVESARVMVEYLEVLAAAGESVPVIVGGAALSQAFVRETLQPAYPGRVHYARDAMAGLKLMQEIVGGRV